MMSSKVSAETKACRKESRGTSAGDRANMDVIIFQLASSSNLKLASRCQEFCQKLRLTNMRRSSQRSCRIPVSAVVYISMHVDKRCTKGCVHEDQYQQLVQIGNKWYRCIRIDMRELPCSKRHATYIAQEHRVSLMD